MTYSRHGLRPPQWQIPKRDVWSERAKAVRTMLQDSLPPVKIACALTLLVLLALLAGCATQSPPETWPTNPQPPRLSEPIPTESYSSKAQKLLEKFRSAVTGM